MLDQSETPREFFVNITTRLIHKTSSAHQFCLPAVSDVVGYSDSLDQLVQQGFIPCPVCISEKE